MTALRKLTKVRNFVTRLLLWIGGGALFLFIHYPVMMRGLLLTEKAPPFSTGEYFLYLFVSILCMVSGRYLNVFLDGAMSFFFKRGRTVGGELPDDDPDS